MTKYATIIFATSLITISCSLQKNHQFASSQALAADAHSISDALSLNKIEMKTRTGVYSLENGGNSFLARVWLFQHAQQSINIQYFSFSKDETGLIACDQLLRAADRGVKVRILIDDAAGKMRDREIRLLDSHDNIEVRVYNAGIRLGRVDRKVLKLVDNSNRLLRRMHNKLITIDDEIAITGGRNIADKYFDQDKKYNFRDRDLLLFGKVVENARLSFEKFWNDELTVGCAELCGKNKKRWLTDPERFDDIHKEAAQTFSTELKEKANEFQTQFKKDAAEGKLVWVNQASYVSDEPGKDARGVKQIGSVCTDSLMDLIRKAKICIDIQTPYLILPDSSLQLISEAIKRGVKIRILTNSLASIDNVEAFSAYQKGRPAILKAGVLLYEFKPDAEIRYKLMSPLIRTLNYKSAYGLHSKTMIIDHRIVLVGAYNLDPRSAAFNTEGFCILRSAQAAKNLSNYVEEEFLPENSWHTTLDYNPDAAAGIRKRFKAIRRWSIPKKLL